VFLTASNIKNASGLVSAAAIKRASSSLALRWAVVWFLYRQTSKIVAKNVVPQMKALAIGDATVWRFSASLKISKDSATTPTVKRITRVRR
jgi:hypothetical protein